MRENLVITSVYAHPYVRTGREALSRLCRGGGGESTTRSIRLSWRNVNQFTSRQPMEFSNVQKDIEIPFV